MTLKLLVGTEVIVTQGSTMAIGAGHPACVKLPPMTRSVTAIWLKVCGHNQLWPQEPIPGTDMHTWIPAMTQ